MKGNTLGDRRRRIPTLGFPLGKHYTHQFLVFRVGFCSFFQRKMLAYVPKKNIFLRLEYLEFWIRLDVHVHVCMAILYGK